MRRLGRIEDDKILNSHSEPASAAAYFARQHLVHQTSCSCPHRYLMRYTIVYVIAALDIFPSSIRGSAIPSPGAFHSGYRP